MHKIYMVFGTLLIKCLILKALTVVTATDRRSLNITSSWQSKSLCLVNVDPELRATTVEDLTQTIRRRPDYVTQLTAALLRRRGSVSGYVVETRRHADQSGCASRLSKDSCRRHHSHKNSKKH